MLMSRTKSFVHSETACEKTKRDSQTNLQINGPSTKASTWKYSSTDCAVPTISKAPLRQTQLPPYNIYDRNVLSGYIIMSFFDTNGFCPAFNGLGMGVQLRCWAQTSGTSAFHSF